MFNWKVSKNFQSSYYFESVMDCCFRKPKPHFFRTQMDAYRWMNRKLLRNNPMGTPHRFDVDLTLILRRYVEDQMSTNFHVISTFFFDVISLIEKSTSFSRTFFDVISMVEISAFFPRTFFDIISMFEKSTLFPRTFFNVISLVEKSTLFPLTFST